MTTKTLTRSPRERRRQTDLARGNGRDRAAARAPLPPSWRSAPAEAKTAALRGRRRRGARATNRKSSPPTRATSPRPMAKVWPPPCATGWRSIRSGWRPSPPGLEAIAELPDPVGRSLARWTRPNGLDIERVAVPLGVIGIIYESRPNVTADAGGLALKSGNAAILRGGSESFYSSRALVAALGAGLRAAGLPEAAIQLVPTRDRAAVGLMLGMNEVHRHDRAARRAIADRAGAAREPDPGDRPSRRHLPHLCRWRSRPRKGAQDRAQRQDAPGVDLRCNRDIAGRPQRRGKSAAADSRRPARRRLRIARRRCRQDDRSRRAACDRGGLAHRISRRDPVGCGR